MTKKNVFELANKINLYDTPFDILLAMVDSLFPTTDKVQTTCYNYSIGRMPHGWRFIITNDWHQWMEKKYKHQFGDYEKPAHCLAEFLEYIVKKNIDPAKLYNNT